MQGGCVICSYFWQISLITGYVLVECGLVFLGHYILRLCFIFRLNQVKATWRRIMSTAHAGPMYATATAAPWTIKMKMWPPDLNSGDLSFHIREVAVGMIIVDRQPNLCFRDPDQAFHGWHSGLLINPHATKWWRSWRKLSGLISGSDTIRLASKHLLINSIIHRLWPPRLLLR